MSKTEKIKKFNNFKYREYKDYIKLIEYKGNEEEVSIPEKINDKNVTCAESSFIHYSESIKKIYIPRFFKAISIGNTFCYAGTVEEFIVDPQNRDYSSEDGVLFDKNKTTLILYPNTKPDTKYIVPESVVKVESHAFSNSIIEEVVLPEGLIHLGDSVFHSCEALEKVNIPLGINCIPNGTFACTGIEYFHVPSHIKTIHEEAFMLSGLKEITFEEGLEEIKYNAFHYCSDIKYIKLPNSLKIIGSNAFEECYNLEEVKVPETIEDIEEGAFYNVPGLKNGLGIDVVYASNKTILKSVSNTSLKKLDLPNSVNIIKNHAFNECIELEEITFPNRMSFIEDDIFNIEYLKFSDRKIIFSIRKINIRFQEKTETIHFPDFKYIPSYLAIGFLECIKLVENGEFFDFDLYDRLFKYLKDEDFKKVMAKSRLDSNYKLTDKNREIYVNYLNGEV